MTDPQILLAVRLRQAIVSCFGDAFAETDPLVRPAQNTRFGDCQANVAMSLAKQLGRKPRDVADQVVQALDIRDLCERPTVAGPGFINVRFDDAYLSDLAREIAADPRLGVAAVMSPKTVVIDYSSPNVAKEMHVGHLRSTIIGDALARTLEFLGHRVIRQNHIGDWGTQFGMLIERLLEAGGEEESSVADLNAFYREAKGKFDADPAFAERARGRVVKLQGGDAETGRLWKRLVTQSQTHFREAYDRLGVTLRDTDICGESVYNPKLEPVLQALGDRDLTRLSDGATCVFVPGFEGREGEPVPLIVRKSDGGFGYAATDLAAIRYRVQELGADRIAYVVDARQKDHFEQIFWTATQAGWLDEDHTAEHVRFGTMQGEDNRPFRTREGDTVKLIDLLNEAEQRAAAVIESKNPDMPPEQRADVARMVGIGSVKYGDLSTDRVKDYVFSWDRMLAMDGNTAPYLQYAYARNRSIFRKAGVDPADLVPGSLSIEHDAERALVLAVAGLGRVAVSVGDRLEPHHLCAWLYDLATAYSRFFEQCPVLRAETQESRDSRLVLCDLVARCLERGLGLLGINVPQQM
ncbi:MAG: arginine--tRNA ligase [Phycisphaerae bacterium]|nr:arginine--tRNA ligase [Phycisphaerae bacterium]